jgi:hypothetical protein
MKGTLTQLRYIPEQWTDFIFAVPGEEFGFVGSCLVLGLLVFLIFRLVRLARMSRNEFESAFTFGLAAVLSITPPSISVWLSDSSRLWEFPCPICPPVVRLFLRTWLPLVSLSVSIELAQSEHCSFSEAEISSMNIVVTTGDCNGIWH